jgi:hypothetical protein
MRRSGHITIIVLTQWINKPRLFHTKLMLKRPQRRICAQRLENLCAVPGEAAEEPLGLVVQDGLHMDDDRTLKQTETGSIHLFLSFSCCT